MFGLRLMEGYVVNAEKLSEAKTQDLLKNKSECLPAITINGQQSPQDDLVLFQEICIYCVASTTKLELKFMDLQVDVSHMATFPNLEELDINNCKLNFSLIQFDQWCPNLVSLRIRNTRFDQNNWCDDWLSITEEHKSLQLRNLTWELNIESKEDVYKYFRAMEKQFPLLENLFLQFDFNMDFTLNDFEDFGLGTKYTTYESVYFNNLKKLVIFAFGQCDDIFNYLKISNKNVKDIEFNGMNADRNIIKALRNYPQLTKLKLACPYVYENELHLLTTSLPRLMTLILDIKYFHWEPADMMKFIQNAKKLRRLQIDVDRKSEGFRINERFKEEFQILIDSGRKFLQLHIKFFESSQEIQFSRKVMIDKPPYSESEEDSHIGDTSEVVADLDAVAYSDTLDDSVPADFMIE